MLTRIGKLAAMVTMAGGAMMMRPGVAQAGPSCTNEEAYEGYCMGGGWCYTDEEGNNYCLANTSCYITYTPHRTVNWGFTCYNNYQDPCPGTIPCG